MKNELVSVITLIELLAKYGGKIVSSNDLSTEEIKQARASERMYVDENSLGYIWVPHFKQEFPTTDKEVELFEKCYPIQYDLPKDLTADKIFGRIEAEEKQKKSRKKLL